MTPRKHDQYEDEQVSEISPLLNRNPINDALYNKESDITEEDEDDVEEEVANGVSSMEVAQVA